VFLLAILVVIASTSIQGGVDLADAADDDENPAPGREAARAGFLNPGLPCVRVGRTTTI
jgi:hypothetical protein